MVAHRISSPTPARKIPRTNAVKRVRHGTGALTPRQATFVREYFIDRNGKQAAIRSGYSTRTAETQASVWLRYPKVAAVVAEQGKAHAPG